LGLAESAFGESLESGGRFCISVFGREDICRLNYLKYYKLCIFNYICKIILQYVQQKNVFLSMLTGHTLCQGLNVYHRFSTTAAAAIHVDTASSVMAQVVSRQPLTAEARVRTRVNPCGICGEQSGTGTGFLRFFRFYPVIIIPPSLSKLISSGECVIC
jgi:hypothetical protein